jgi:hypothetical protein
VSESVYAWLLKLCPEEVEREFGPELKAVFAMRLEECETGKLRFLAGEMVGLLSIGLGARWNLWPLVGGLGVAAALHFVMYSIIGRLLLNVGGNFKAVDQNQALTMAIWGMFAVLGLMPLFVILAGRVRRCSK